MISTILKMGAGLAAMLSIWIGMCLYTSIPRQVGFYQFLATLQPALIGISPAFTTPDKWKYTWEEYYSEDTHKMLQGQSAIVTGGNSGIGFDLAMALVRNGVDVTITCRTEAKCVAAKEKIDQAAAADNDHNGNLFFFLLDTSSFASVRFFCEQYVNTFAKEKPIDMLFFNAGTNFLNLKNPEENPDCSPKTKEDGIEYLFQVNYLSHHLMYQLLEPYLATNARIVQTSSASSFSTYSYKVATNLETLHGCSEPYLQAFTSENLSYGQSKLAQDVWCKTLTRKLANKNDSNNNKTNISANAFHPGLVNTPIFHKIYQVSDAPKSMEDWMTNTVMPKYAWQSPDGALTGLYLATHPDIKGKYYHPQAQEVVNPLADDEELQDKLWDFSNELVKDYLAPIPMVAAATIEEEEDMVEEVVAGGAEEATE
jgi:NAD(P)-dependent dehydrogenase (short-subunit alcohol dehydrogenase family)